MTDYKVLDLFCGLGGFSQAFEDSERWDVTTVDIEARFEPDIVADVFDLRPSDFDTDFDVVLASPPCTQFSIAASSLNRFADGEPQTEDARDAVGLLYHAMGLIQGLTPEYWFMENPQGHMRQVIGKPSARVTYCQYGMHYMKPTDLWGSHPAAFRPQKCSPRDDCHAFNTDDKDDGKTRSAFQQTTPGGDSAQRSLVPYDLSESIRDACEAALDGRAVEQTTLDV